MVIDIGRNGKSGDVVDIEHLTPRPTARPSRARRQHSEAIDMPTLTPLDPLRQAAEGRTVGTARLAADDCISRCLRIRRKTPRSTSAGFAVVDVADEEAAC